MGCQNGICPVLASATSDGVYLVGLVLHHGSVDPLGAVRGVFPASLAGTGRAVFAFDKSLPRGTVGRRVGIVNAGHAAALRMVLLFFLVPVARIFLGTEAWRG